MKNCRAVVKSGFCGSVPALAGLLTCFLAGLSGFGQSPPTAIGSGVELFVDDELVQQMRGVSLQLHRPSMAEVALSFDRPWEGSGNHYITVFQDGPIYRMYYRCVPGSQVPASGVGWVLRTCYAESNDGVHWNRPDLGLFEFGGNKHNNIVWNPPNQPMDYDTATNFTVFKDLNPDAASSEKYKAVGGESAIGLFAFVSPDAIHWRQKGSQPILTKTMTKYPMPNAFDSANLAFWDTVQKRYVGYIRDEYPASGTGEMTRGIRRTTSPDFEHWSVPEWIDMGDGPAPHFYTNSITPYFRAPNIYLGFPMRYMPFRNAVLPSMYDAARGKGVTDSMFMVSRDGEHWRRYPEAFILPGIDPLDWTDRSNYVAWGLVPTGKDEISLYVLEHFRLPSIRVRRAVLRTDGFVSASASSGGGELVTKPIVFQGSRLTINYSTSAAGGVRVEIQDQDGKPLPGFRLEDSRELFGNSVQQEVNWESGPDVGAIQGRPIRLRFVMKEADLYSFQFCSAKPR